MFYSQFILAKKGPLGTIWIAAHLERKLRKNQVADTDIGVSVDSILSPDVPIALRLSSHLLLGVVRIYSRKVNYLFHDCSEALLKVKQAFRSTAVDLPPEESTAPYHSITLPETFDLDDFELPDTDNFQGNFVDHHVSTREQITLQDSMDGVVYSTSQFGLDERFGDGDTSHVGFDLDEELFLDNLTASGQTASIQPMTPMTPYMGMDVDDDDVMTGEERIAEVTVKDGNIDSDTQNVYVVNDTSLRVQNQSLSSDGHVFPSEQAGAASTGTPDGPTQCAPYIPRLAEEVPANVHFNKDQLHALVNETSLSNFEEVIMQEFPNNNHYESEHCDPKLTNQEILENNPSEYNVHTKQTNEAGDCSFPNNKSSETDVSRVPDNTHAKENTEDTTSIAFDIGRAVASPNSVLAEQMKPTSPSAGIIDSSSAIPEVLERAVSTQNGNIISENSSSLDARMESAECSQSRGLILGNLSFSDVTSIQANVFPFVDVGANTAPESVVMENCYQPIPSSEGVSANSVLTDNHQIVRDGISESHHVSHTEISGSHNLRDFLDLEAPRGDDSLLVAEGPHVYSKEVKRFWSGPEVTNIQHSAGPEQESCEPRHVLRPCSFLYTIPDTPIPADTDLSLNLADLSLGGDQPSSSVILRQKEHAHISAAPALVQGEDCPPPTIRNAALEAHKISESVPSNGMEAGPSNLHEGIDTVRSRDQLGNFSGGWNFAAPEYERLLSAPAAVPFGVNDFLGQSNFEKDLFAEHQINEFNSLSGRKRHQMESTPAVHYGSSATFSGMVSRRTVDSIPDDFDVLSSILVGRKSSAIKLRPTPQQSETSKKRQRVAPRTNVAKRKVLLDDTMVLHGDTIRLQLTSTEDIRRVRKKAPCTRPEIWMIQTHLLEDEIFAEPLFTGISLDLHSVYNRKYDVASISRVSEMNVANMLPEVRDKVLLPESSGAFITESMESQMNMAKNPPEVRAEVFLPKTPDLNEEANKEEMGEPVPVVDASEIHQHTEAFIQSDRGLCEDHIKPVECDIEEHTRLVTEISPSDLDKDPLNIAVTVDVDEGSEVAARTHDTEIIVNEHSLVTSIVPEDTCSKAVGLENELLPMDGRDTVSQNIERLENGVASERGEDRCDDIIHDVNVNQEDPPLIDGVLTEGARSLQEIFGSNSVKVAEQNLIESQHVDLPNGCSPMGVMLDNNLTENRADVLANASTSVENDKSFSLDRSTVNELPTDPTKMGIRDETEHMVVDESVRKDTQYPSSPRSRGDPHNDIPRPLEFDANTELIHPVEGENLGSEEVAQERSEDGRNLNSPAATPGGIVDDTAEDTASPGFALDLEDRLYENDTEFLNDDYDNDNEAMEEDDDNMPDTEEAAAILDNSGWSSRTRGVAKYLQTVFDTETGHGRKNLSMDNLLYGKTRKEASRMFFETLVLKTRDYVHVEQGNPFESINIKPRGKLMKSEF
ncbi:hypothetical protein ACHQM5_028539 [Ranunculus cassubicifolius]